MFRCWIINKRPRDQTDVEVSNSDTSPEQPSKKVRSADPNVEHKSAGNKQRLATKPSGRGKWTLPGVRSAIRAFNAPRSDKRFLDVD
jgi:hypothetical protein